MAGSLGAVESGLEGLRGDLAPLPGGVGLSEKLEQIQGALSMAADHVAPLDDGTVSGERAVHELPAKLEEIEQQLDALRTDLSGTSFAIAP